MAFRLGGLSASREDLTFRVLEGILEAVKTKRMEDTIMTHVDRRIEEIIERKLNDK